MNLSIVNLTDGTVEVHAAGCADTNRNRAKGRSRNARIEHKFDEEHSSKFAAWVDYNSDFLAEGSGAYDLDFKPCCSDLADGEFPMTEEGFQVYQYSQVIEVAPVISTKVGRKWTYIYRNDVLIAEVANEHTAVIAALLSAN